MQRSRRHINFGALLTCYWGMVEHRCLTTSMPISFIAISMRRSPMSDLQWLVPCRRHSCRLLKLRSASCSPGPLMTSLLQFERCPTRAVLWILCRQHSSKPQPHRSLPDTHVQQVSRRSLKPCTVNIMLHLKKSNMDPADISHVRTSRAAGGTAATRTSQSV